MDEKNILPRKGSDQYSFLDMIINYGYRKGVEDATRGVRAGIGMVLTGLLGTVIVATLIERHKERKQTEEISE